MMTVAHTDLHSRIDQLAQIHSEVLGGGVTREVYTPAYVEATELVSAWMREVGLQTRVDSVGNLFGRWVGSEPDLPRVLTGSHFDTTLDAGRYDGVLGVLGAIDVIGQLRATGFEPRRSIEIVGFAGEEPRFGAGCIGSRAMVGTLKREDLDTMHDRNGVSIAEAMREVGLDPDRLDDAVLDDENVHMLVELHIEQGPELEADGIAIGVVERIAAPHDLRVRLLGEARHSGSTPMRMRHDALVGAAEIIVAVERLAKEARGGTAVGTVGMLNLTPGAVNVIPGEVTIEIDIRDSDLAARIEVTEALLATIKQIAGRRELALSIVTTALDEPAACDQRIVSAVRDAADELGLSARGIVSGAYHDSMVLGSKVPIGMIFVPSVGGLSHHPDEYTAPTDLEHGVAVLAGTLMRLAA
jgi:hydantoinase/carbamoylase family amidase